MGSIIDKLYTYLLTEIFPLDWYLKNICTSLFLSQLQVMLSLVLVNAIPLNHISLIRITTMTLWVRILNLRSKSQKYCSMTISSRLKRQVGCTLRSGQITRKQVFWRLRHRFRLWRWTIPLLSLEIKEILSIVCLILLKLW